MELYLSLSIAEWLQELKYMFIFTTALGSITLIETYNLGYIKIIKGFFTAFLIILLFVFVPFILTIIFEDELLMGYRYEDPTDKILNLHGLRTFWSIVLTVIICSILGLRKKIISHYKKREKKEKNKDKYINTFVRGPKPNRKKP